MDIDLTELVAVLTGCGAAVAAAIEPARRSDDRAALASERGLGADGAPTSQIDALAEQAALDYLAGLAEPWQANILSEECGLLARGHRLTYVIDPIDATHNATTGFPYYAFSIAALDARPLASCVINLPTGDCWTAARGQGAWLNGRRLAPLSAPPLAEASLAVVRPMNADDFARLQPIFFGARRLRITGCTALDVCLTASGSLHGFVNANRFLNPLWGEKVVDYAGAALVLEEVGGALCDQRGRPLDYPLDLQHRLCLQAAAGPRLLAELIACLGATEG